MSTGQFVHKTNKTTKIKVFVVFVCCGAGPASKWAGLCPDWFTDVITCSLEVKTHLLVDKVQQVHK